MGRLQTPFPPALHLQMDLRTDTGATEVPDVPTGMDIRAASPEVNEVQLQPPKHLAKYYYQRYRLFHRFDEGVRLDEESWYSVTPEKIAQHIAARFAGKDVILDLFCGAGGNAIQFALSGAFVIAVEMSPQKIALAVNNAIVYGVAQYIDFVQADVYQFVPVLAKSEALVEGVFMSPPWGGPDYRDQEVFDVSVFGGLVNLAKEVSEDVGILLPRTVELDNVKEQFGQCEVEHNYLGNRLKTTTVYFGGLVGKPAIGFGENPCDMSGWLS